MTNDFKEKTLKYLTGKLNEEIGKNEPQFIDKGNINQNVYDYLDENFDYGVYVIDSLQQPNTDYILFYGYYYADSERTEAKGFLCITTRELEPVQIMTSYDSGTDFRPFYGLNIDEDGYFYGVDTNAERSGNYRFIMLNKIIINRTSTGNFSTKLRQSYYFDSTIEAQILNLNSRNNLCTKKIGSADYFFFADYLVTGNDYGFCIVSLTVNVGESNTWTMTKSTDIHQAKSYINQYSNNDGFSIIIGGYGDDYRYRELIYQYGDTPSLTLKCSFPSLSSYQSNGSVSDTIMTSINNTYINFDWRDTDNMSNSVIYKLNYNDLTYNPIYTFDKVPYAVVGSSANFYKVEGDLFFKYSWTSEENNTTLRHSSVGIIIDETLYKTEISVADYDSSVGLFINKLYNLYNIYSPLENSQCQKIQLIYNPNNYNGLPYEAPNGLVPNSGVLYNSNDNIIFARNLYNKTVSGATTTSVIQIPNILLNDDTISQSNLIGQTNVELVNDTTEITKNVYETVDLNFSNTLIIRNDNDGNNKILNPIGSARLNDSISQTIDYENAQATKLKINYTDNTSEVIQLSSSQIKLVSNYTAKYVFSVYAKKEITNIQIISYDENTVYQTINNLSLTVGKTYNFIQYVSMLEEIIRDEVLYNSEAVNYNNEQVLYIN